MFPQAVSIDVNRVFLSSAMVSLAIGKNVYQNPDDLPPGGFRTLIVARGPLLSSSSAQIKENVVINFH